MKFINNNFFRFLIAGCINTLLSYLIYLLLLIVLPYKYAYSISYVIGILISYTINALFVFNQSFSWKKLIQYPIVYLVQYVFGLLLVTVLVDNLDVSVNIAPAINVVIFIPITYFLSKVIIKSGVEYEG